MLLITRATPIERAYCHGVLFFFRGLWINLKPCTLKLITIFFLQAKERIQQTNAEEDFSTDADENGIPDALENVIPNLRASAPGPVAQVATSPVAVSAPEPQQQQVDPVFDAVQQTPVTNVQSDPNTFIQRTPQGFQFSFVAPTQNANPQQLQQARALPLTLPQFQFGQFQPQPFQPQSFQFSPQFAAFN